jgi:hypothetical protein
MRRWFVALVAALVPYVAEAQVAFFDDSYQNLNLITVPDLTAGAQNTQRYSTVFGTANNGVYDFGTKGISNFDGVLQLVLVQPGGSFTCTASLIDGGRQILTAAHCVAATSGVNAGQNVTTTVQIRAYGPGGVYQVIGTEAGSQIKVMPGYTGSVVDVRDLAVIKLSSPLPAWVTSYNVGFTKAPLGRDVVLSGYGRTGNGATGDALSSGNIRRAGLNKFDATRTTTSITPLNDFGILFGDFDNGTAAGNRNCNIFGGVNGAYFQSFPQYLSQLCDTGVADFNMEVGIGRGDSGGAAFLDGEIIGVASFGESAACTIGGQPSSCVGAFGRGFGYTNLTAGPARDWLMTEVPEPSTYLLMGTGLLGVFGFSRRRRA